MLKFLRFYSSASLFAIPFLYILSKYTQIYAHHFSYSAQLAFYYYSARHKTENDSS